MYFPLLYSNRKRVLWAVINDSLCVFQKSAYSRVNEYDKNWSMAFLPIPFDKAAFGECTNILSELNRSGPINIHNIDARANATLLGAVHNIRFKSEGKDYIYNVPDSRNLAGSDYKKIRYYIRHFGEKNHPKIETYTPDMYRECLKIFNGWKKRKLQEGDAILFKEHTKEVFRELHMFDDMFGIVVRVKGEPVAFTLGGILSETRNMATCIIRKTEAGMKGLSEYIDWNFYNHLPANITTVNDGDDCLSASLAGYKMKWHPAKVQPIFGARINAR